MVALLVCDMLFPARGASSYTRPIYQPDRCTTWHAKTYWVDPDSGATDLPDIGKVQEFSKGKYAGLCCDFLYQVHQGSALGAFRQE